MSQFGSQKNVAKLSEPLYFCLPVVKSRVKDEEKPTIDHVIHYAVYGEAESGEAEPLKIDFTTSDQFGDRELTARKTAFFAVPSTKQGFVEHDD